MKKKNRDLNFQEREIEENKKEERKAMKVMRL